MTVAILAPARLVMVSAIAALAAVSTAATTPAHSQSYPERPIIMVVPFAAGGTSDVIGRLVAEEMGKHLGQRLVIENIGGAGGQTGLTRVARAAPDGYTITIGNAGTNAAIYWTNKAVPFTADAFEPVAMVAKTSPIIALKNGFPARTVAEFKAYAKANPGKVTLGHAGVGSSNYLICQSFIQAAEVEVALVSYRGAGPALNDALAGQIDGVCDAATSLSGAIQSKLVQALVLSGPTRLTGLPDVMTAVEAGIERFQAQGWNAIFVPKGTPRAIIERLRAAIGVALDGEFLRTRFQELMTQLPDEAERRPEFLAGHVAAEIEKYRVLIERAK